MMMQRKKIFAWLMALAMLLALLPVAALADGQMLSMNMSILAASGTLSGDAIAENETGWSLHLAISGTGWEEQPELGLLLGKPDGSTESITVSVEGKYADGAISGVSKTLDGSKFDQVGTYTLTLMDDQSCAFVSRTFTVTAAAEETATPKPTATPNTEKKNEAQKAEASKEKTGKTGKDEKTEAEAKQDEKTKKTEKTEKTETKKKKGDAAQVPFAMNNVLTSSNLPSGANGKPDLTIALNSQTIRVGEALPAVGEFVTVTGLQSGDSAPALANVQIEVYNTSGQLVTDTKNLSSGVYTARWSNLSSIKNDASWNTLSQKYDITWPSSEVTTLTITNMHEVSFDLNYANAPEWASKTVIDGYALQEPTYAPTRSGYTFAGWYTEAECTHAYDFSTPVTSDFTLYARWRNGGGSSTSPETGDSNYLVAWLVATAVFGVCTVLLVAAPRKRKGMR